MYKSIAIYVLYEAWQEGTEICRSSNNCYELYFIVSY
jgi:hypothetical protein